MDSHVRVHAVLCQWIEWFEAQEATDLAAVASDNETIAGIPFTSQDKTAQTQLDNEDDDDAKDTQPGTQEMLSTEAALPVTKPVEAMPLWASQWAKELTLEWESQKSQESATATRSNDKPPAKKAKLSVPKSKDLRDMLNQVIAPAPTQSSQEKAPQGALEVVPRPFWTLERKAEAEASVQKFVDLTNRVFAGQATRSLKFTCLNLVTDALEVATRLKNFLGKDHPPVPVELLAKPGQWQAPLGQQSPYVTTGGNENNVVPRVHFPRKMSARTGKGACASVQVNMCRGQPGARPVTVQGSKQCFQNFCANWITTMGPMEHNDTDGKVKVDAFM